MTAIRSDSQRHCSLEEEEKMVKRGVNTYRPQITSATLRLNSGATHSLVASTIDNYHISDSVAQERSFFLLHQNDVVFFEIFSKISETFSRTQVNRY
jgi:hypothetical protein